MAALLVARGETERSLAYLGRTCELCEVIDGESCHVLRVRVGRLPEVTVKSRAVMEMMTEVSAMRASPTRSPSRLWEALPRWGGRVSPEFHKPGLSPSVAHSALGRLKRGAAGWHPSDKASRVRLR